MTQSNAAARSSRIGFALALLLIASSCFAAKPAYQHGISLLYELKYPAGFAHFDYVDPRAPKGGTLMLSTTAPIRNFSGAWGTGVSSAAGIQRTNDRLFARSADEQAAMYGVLAEGVALSDDRKSLYIRLHAAARWHDDVPVTTEDVRFSYDALMSSTLSVFGKAYLDSWIESIEYVNSREFVIHHREVFTQSNLMALTTLPIRPAHYYGDRDPWETTLEPPLGNGPYRVESFDQDYVRYERVPDYWGRDLPVNRGRYNFDAIRYDVYRDATVAREAFQKGLIDVLVESDVRFWHASFEVPALQTDRVIRDTRRVSRYVGQAWALAFNLERDMFQDVRVREALTLAYDFEWQNRVLQYGSQNRALSYFAGSSLASQGMPSAAEIALLEPWRSEVPERVFTKPFRLPESTGRGVHRAALERAQALLKEAGWVIVDGRLVDTNGKPFAFEIATQHAWSRRLLLPYVQSLRSLGIDARLRLLDRVIAVRFKRQRRFDMIFRGLDLVNPPIASLNTYFGSANADREAGGNLGAIREPAVDALIDVAQRASSFESAQAACRALDRVLLWGFYHVPLNMPDEERYLYWDKFGRPDDSVAIYEYLNDGQARLIDGWWYDAGKAEPVGTFASAD